MHRASSRIIFPLLALTGLCATSAAHAAPVPVYREIKDWTVICDNTATCEARGLPDEYPSLIVRLVAQAGPDGARTLSLESEQPLDSAWLRLDGKPIPLSWSAWETVNQDGLGTLSTDDPEAIRAFLQHVRNSTRLEVATHEEPLIGSLSGLNAALLLIDETQGRLDTVTALLRRGERPASTVPPAPQPPLLPAAAKAPAALDDAARARLIAAVRKAQSALLLEEDCQEADSERSFDDAEALGANEALVLLQCFSGAYQYSSLAFRTPLADPAQAQRLRLTLPAPLANAYGRSEVEFFTNASYDPETATLYHAAKGRGLADCGESMEWRFDGQRFQLAQMNYLSACRGGGPGDWPTLWRTRATPAR